MGDDPDDQARLPSYRLDALDSGRVPAGTCDVATPLRSTVSRSAFRASSILVQYATE